MYRYTRRVSAGWQLEQAEGNGKIGKDGMGGGECS